MQNIYYSSKQKSFYQRITFWDWGFIFKPIPDISLADVEYKILPSVSTTKFYPAKNFPFVSHENQLAIVSLFRDTCDTHKTEICIYLAKDKGVKENELFPYLFEQSTTAGSVDGLTSELYSLTTGELKTTVITRLGTVHSHNYFSAFFSKTDDSNDLFNPGLHFVIGHLNSQPNQVSSVVIDGVRYTAPLIIDPGILEGVSSIPKKYHTDLVDKLLTYNPVMDYQFVDLESYYLGYSPEVFSDGRYDYSYYDYNYGDFVTDRYDYDECVYV